MTDNAHPVDPIIHTRTHGIVPNPHRETTRGPQSNSHGCSPSDQQAPFVTIEAMDEQMFSSEYDYRAERQIAFNMPASWEEMEALGLDPLTGEPI